jgi:hypothetical protein
MTSTKPRVADAKADQSRREALKNFGRFAAVAPTTMVLLDSREGSAKPGNGRGWGRGGRWGQPRNSHY